MPTPYPHARPPHGYLEVIAGPMFSGKSEELIRRLTRAVIARQQVTVFKPALDDRYERHHIASHAGRQLQAVAVADVAEMAGALAGGTLPDVVGIDEAQFFGSDLVPLVLQLAGSGVRVILAGLDLDFRGEPFGVMPQLLARAESVEKLTAICTVCGGPATRSQRLIGGEPAPHDSPVVLVGAAESYEARCRLHHEVPGLPPQQRQQLP